MTLQANRQSDNQTTQPHSSARQPNRYRWLLAVLFAMAIAAIVGVAVTAQLTGPAPTKRSVYHEPNPNTRESRVPTPTSVDNPNTRESRISGG